MAGSARAHLNFLQPLHFPLTLGFSRVGTTGGKTKTVSTVFRPIARCRPAKPLKRLRLLRLASTGLKPGVNETLQKVRCAHPQVGA